MTDQPKLTNEQVSALAASTAMEHARQLGLSLGDQWAVDSARKAALLFRSKSLKPMAAIMAAAHPRALDYLEQAPVLVLAVMDGQTNFQPKRRHFAISQWGTVCGRGSKLKDLMRLYQLRLPLRAIRASAVYALAWPAIKHLNFLDPSTLAQVIPPHYQAHWLKAINAWVGNFQRRTNVTVPRPIPHLDWIGRHWQDEADVRKGRPEQASDMADFAFAYPHFSTKWTWATAAAARDRWHRDTVKLAFSDAKVDTSPFPPQLDVQGFQFVALDSPLELAAEGMALHHCVASYAQRLVSGTSRIVSCRKDGRRIATAEFARRLVQDATWTAAGELTAIGHAKTQWTLVQFKAVANSMPPADAKSALEAYFKIIRASLELDRR